MLVAIDTSDVSDWVNDHPTEAYAAIGVLVLLLILFLLVRNRRKHVKSGPPVSWRERRRLRKQAKEGKKPSRKQRRQERKDRRKRIAEEKRRAEEQDRRAWEEERTRRREERRKRKEERQRRKAARKGTAPPEPEEPEEPDKPEKPEESERSEETAMPEQPEGAEVKAGDEKSTMLATALGLAGTEAGEGRDGEEEQPPEVEEEKQPEVEEKQPEVEELSTNGSTEADQTTKPETEDVPARWVPPGSGSQAGEDEPRLTPIAPDPDAAPGGFAATAPESEVTAAADEESPAEEESPDEAAESEAERDAPVPEASGAETAAPMAGTSLQEEID